MRQMRKTRVDVDRMTLPRRALGSTGIEVSAIGLGTVKLGRNTGLSLAPFAIPGTRAARTLLDRASELGVNLLDTAPAYGESEARLGEILDGTRDRWVLCTKAGESFDGRRSHHDFRPAALRESVEASLRRLRTDYLDIVLIHSDGRDAEILRRSDALETLHALKREGKVRASGFSHKTEEGGRLALSRCDVLMSALSFTDRRQIDRRPRRRRERRGSAGEEGPRQRSRAAGEPALRRRAARGVEHRRRHRRPGPSRGRHCSRGVRGGATGMTSADGSIALSELAGLTVHGQTTVGWDERTPPNETVDADGNPNPDDRRFGVRDPRAPARRAPDDPEVVALRRHLRANSGIRGLEICPPGEPARAARIFHRDGFVVVRDLLDATRLSAFRESCARVPARHPHAARSRRPQVPDGKRAACHTATATARVPHRAS